MDAEQKAISAAAPDWSTINRDILCPLCDYNLKMLTEPRCPECGHRFEWADVLAEDRELRGFFEHARGRWLMSIFWTWLASLFSLWFWKRVKTTDPVRLGRVILFAALNLLALVSAIGIMVGVQVWQSYSAARSMHVTALKGIEQQIVFDQMRLARSKSATQYSPYRPVIVPSKFPTTQAYLDATFPPPTVVGAFHAYFTGNRPWLGTFLYQSNAPAVSNFGVAAILAMWPWLTLGLFAIFRVSLRRAGISWPHLLRMVTYCSAILALAPAIWLAVRAGLERPPFFGYTWDLIFRLDEPTARVLLILLAWLAIRLAIAMHRYLRIPQGVIMALLSQIIVMLIALQFLILITPAR